jgi:purine-nucleoside phosphorylase
MSNASDFATFAATVKAEPPEVALILGSGMGLVAQRLRGTRSISFADVPGMTSTSVAGHSGCLTAGEWAGRRVLMFEGRLHHYEGHPSCGVVQPVRLAASLGARVLFLTNAAGGIHDALVPESLMAIRDHIQWTRPYFWREPGPGGIGPQRTSPYSPRLLQLLMAAGRELGMDLPQGIYAAVTGPCYETRAEIRALKTWGADAVGMSTAREIETGCALGLECGAISCITNRAAGLGEGPINHEEVLSAAAAKSHRLADLLERLLTMV